MYQIIVNSLVKIFNEDAYLNKVISAELEKNNFTDLEKRLFTKITYGVVENKIRIDYYLQPFIKGVRVKPFIKNVLRVGVYVINDMDMANHYIVKTLVDLVKKIDLRSTKFVNGVLRNFERAPRRNYDNLNKKEYLSVKYSMPLELINVLISDYGIKLTEEILSAYTNSTNQNTYRINQLIVKDQEQIKKELLNQDEKMIIKEDMIYTKKSLINTSFFKNGQIIAQDYSSTLPARFLNPKENEIVLDTCSAPGMKTIQMAGMMNNKGQIIALDIYEHKLNLINENCQKYNAKIIKTILQDATTTKFETKFDKILVDVPCSGLGVIAHKPDLKYHMTSKKIEELATISYNILNNVSQFLKPKGILVFSTCTITKRENEGLIKKFLNNHQSFVKLQEEKILPSKDKTQDGFYICKLKKEEENE